MNVRLVALRAAVALGIVLLALALWQMREAAQLLAIAVAVSAGLAPLVRRLSTRGLSRSRAAALVFGGSLLLIIGLGIGFGLLLAGDMAQIIDRLPLWYVRSTDWLVAQGGWAFTLATQLPSSEELSARLLGDNSSLGQLLLDGGLQLLTLTALALGAASLGFYWLVDEQRIVRLWLSLLPLDARTRVRALSTAVYGEVGIYVRGVVAMAVLTTITLLVIYKLAGLPGAAVLALMGGLAQVVPLLGPTLAVLPGSLVALGQGQPVAAGVLAAALVALTLLRLGLAPRLLRRGIGVNPVLVVVLIMALAELGGLPLILLAPPLAAALQAGTRAIVEISKGEAARPQSALVSELEQRLAAVAASAAGSPENLRLQSLVARARALLAEARQAV